MVPVTLLLFATFIGSCSEERARSGMQRQALNQTEAKVHLRGVRTTPPSSPYIEPCSSSSTSSLSTPPCLPWSSVGGRHQLHFRKYAAYTRGRVPSDEVLVWEANFVLILQCPGPLFYDQCADLLTPVMPQGQRRPCGPQHWGCRMVLVSLR
eukprot:EG_transcript_27723